MCKHFLKNFEKYMTLAKSKSNLDGKYMLDPLYIQNLGRYDYNAIITRLCTLKQEIEDGSYYTKRQERKLQPPPTNNTAPLIPIPKLESHPNSTAHLSYSVPFIPPYTEHKSFFPVIQENIVSLPPLYNPLPIPNIPISDKIDMDNEIATYFHAQLNNNHPKEITTHVSPFGPGSVISNFEKEFDTITNEKKPSFMNLLSKVKPPSREEMLNSLLKEEEEEALQLTSTSTQNNIICIVCHKELNEYIALPNCAQPHPYCTKCSEKLVERGNMRREWTRKRKRTQPEKEEIIRISCLLCKSISEIDPVKGILMYRRRKNQRFSISTDQIPNEDDIEEKLSKKQRNEATETSTKTLYCPEHNEELLLYCTNYMQLMCSKCLTEDNHAKHNEDSHLPLLDAEGRVREILKKQIEDMNLKRKKLKCFTDTLMDKKKFNTTIS
jgi:hypothetical protein